MSRSRLVLLLTVSLAASLAVSCNRSKPADESGGPSPAPSVPAATSPAAPTSPAPSSPAPATGTVPATPAVVLSPDGVGVAKFGDDADTAIRALTAALGRPDRDTGYVGSFSEFGTCPGDKVRGVIWKDFTVLFAQGRTPARSDGRPHLLDFGYGTTGSSTPAQPKLATSKGIGLGSTLAEIRKAYGPVETYYDEITQSTGFTIGEPPHQLFGFLSGPGPTARLEQLQGGVPCGE